MKALILAAGAGRRLKPLTEQVPKSLIKAGDRTILDRQLESLARHGIDEVIITTGPFEEKIIEHVHTHHSIKASFVYNPRYEVTNYIYSLWLTKDLVDEDVILMHGDLIFDDVLISRLLEAQGSRVLVNREIKPPEKDFKALIENDRVGKIGVELSGADAFFCAPMYKLSRADLRRWFDEMGKFVEMGRTDCYAEDAFNEISGEIQLRPLFFEEFCIEIDTTNDLKEAESWIRNRMRKGKV